MQRTVIFDLDGTLADTSGDLLAAANAAFAAMDHPARLDSDVRADRATAVRGGKAMLRLGLTRQGLRDAGLEEEIERGFPLLLEAYDAAIAVHTRLYPGAAEAVEGLRLRGDRVGICTNKPEGLAEKLMREIGARDLFHSLVGADTLPVRKPDPAPLREAVARAGGEMARTVLVGDTATDRDTARAAGVPCILVTFPPGDGRVAELDPDALIHAFDELPGALARL
jgi:phosphoglycolate phosphatase